MYKNILESIDGIGMYPALSLMIFVIFFAAMFIWVFRADKKHLEEMSHVPLESKDEKTI